MIVAAAVRSARGRVYALPAPARHHDIFRLLVSPVKGQQQGFIDSEQGFVTRETARRIVVEQHQPLRDRRAEPNHPRELFSEDLW